MSQYCTVVLYLHCARASHYIGCVESISNRLQQIDNTLTYIV